MLVQNENPDKEPIVSIGIILPVDNVKEINIEVPGTFSDDYFVHIWDKKIHLPGGTKLAFALVHDQIRTEINGQPQNLAKVINVYPSQYKKKLSPKAGLKVKNIISGRDFHWKKNIDVHLPDKISVRVEGG